MKIKRKRNKNNLKIAIIFICLLVILISVFLVINALKKHQKENEVCFEKKCFTVEKVSSEQDRNKGLMYRDSLNQDSGMLFVFEKESTYAFWMKNTLIPLDMIWINSSMQVTYIYKNATPCSPFSCPPIYPNSVAVYVLEVNSGLSNKYSINIGDKVKIY